MIHHQEGAPTKKIYTITDSGRMELKEWLLSVTDEPVFRKQVLIKLALAELLNRNDLETMLTSYEEVVRMQAALTDRELATCYFAGSDQSDKVWFLNLIRENIVSFNSNELAWIKKVKDLIIKLPDEHDQVMQANQRKEEKEVDLTMN